MNRQIYIHYGATQFNPLLNFPIKNKRCWVKPKGGLWASRKNASFGWKNIDGCFYFFRNYGTV